MSTIEVPTVEDAALAVRHLKEILYRFDGVVWATGTSVKVSMELQGESATQRMAAWRRIVAGELETLGIEIVSHG